jgi:hypothetical protein
MTRNAGGFQPDFELARGHQQMLRHERAADRLAAQARATAASRRGWPVLVLRKMVGLVATLSLTISPSSAGLPPTVG